MPVAPESVFLLGAGFTRAYSDRAPVMADFLQIAERAGFYKPLTDHKLLAQIGDKYFGSTTGPNIETLATFLTTDVGSDPFKEREHREAAYADLVQIIQNTLADIYDFPRGAATKDAFLEFGRYVVKHHIPVVTFNYDLVLDQILRDTDRWFPIDGYGVRIPITLPEPQASALEQEEKTKFGKNPISMLCENMLLKLHGSLNWGLRYVPLSGAPQHVELGTSGAFPKFGGNKVLPISGTVHGVGLGPRFAVNHYFRPFIVPPISVESVPGEEGRLLRSIWHSAQWAIVLATEVHVLGYSMPPSDFEVDVWLREALYGQVSKPKRVIVVDRDPNVAARITKFGGRGITTLAGGSDIEAYLKTVV